jgi:L-amino acid N-acyltransferase YncA
MLQIRTAITTDAKAITEIYNHAILYTTATFDTEIKSVKNREEWLLQHNSKYPVVVAELDNMVVGFASMTRWSDRAAYDDTAEISIYIIPQQHNKGLGNLLMQAIIEKGKQGGLHCILSRITEGNDKSIYLHQKFGFEMVGVLKEVGKKFGNILDVTILQLLYKE